jgi:hypothetical protein
MTFNNKNNEQRMNLNKNIYRFKIICKVSVISTIFILVNSVSVEAQQIAMFSQAGDYRIQGTKENIISGHTPMIDSFSITLGVTIENYIQDNDVEILDHENHEVKVGPDGILGTKDDLSSRVMTDIHGEYHFDIIPPDTYRTIVTTH